MTNDTGMPTVNPAQTPEQIRAYFQAQRKQVVTFLGYSGAEYEDTAAMLSQATAILDRLDPARTIVNIGATADGIGALYDVAVAKGFQTTGIVSTQARDNKVALSPSVQTVFYVTDALWGGSIEGTGELSPTSRAMVDASDRFIAVGGGDVARDELVAAKAIGKPVQFIPADMNHALAREKAAKAGQPAPTDFRGSAHTVFGGAD